MQKRLVALSLLGFLGVAGCCGDQETHPPVIMVAPAAPAAPGVIKNTNSNVDTKTENVRLN